MLQKPYLRGEVLKLLVPTDFSGSGINAAAFAIQLFHKKTGEMILENVFQTPKEKLGTLISVSDIIANESKSLLEKERRHLKAEYNDVNISVQSEEGSIVHTIKKAIAIKNINLLVLGMQKNARRLSSIINSFIEYPQYWPMLTVPQRATTNQSKELLIMVSEDAGKEKSLELATYLEQINMHTNKMYYLELGSKENMEQLKNKIGQLLEKHKVGLIVFNTSKGDRLQKGIIMHEFDNLLLTFPALII